LSAACVLFSPSFRDPYMITDAALLLPLQVREIDQNEAELQAEEDAELVGKNFFMRWWLR